MTRSDQPLVERMALIWHDWFATSDAGVGPQKLMLEQVELFRQKGLGSFDELSSAVTTDPAMLIWLNGNDNTKRNPDENYAREMMELFSLGADRGAYSETDVREAARALADFRDDWRRARAQQLPLRRPASRRDDRDPTLEDGETLSVLVTFSPQSAGRSGALPARGDRGGCRGERFAASAPDLTVRRRGRMGARIDRVSTQSGWHLDGLALPVPPRVLSNA